MNEKRNHKVEKYVGKLKRSLHHLSQTDRDDIAREIEGHIVERWEVDSNGAFDDAALTGVFGKMGTPESLAAQYCEQRGWASPPPKHTLRNGLLIALAIVVVGFLGFGYFATRYVVAPIVKIVTGSKNLIEMSDNGIKIMDGKISLTDDGIKVGGSVHIGSPDSDDGDIELDVGGGISINDMAKKNELAVESGKFTIETGGATGLKLNIRNTRMDVMGADVPAISVEYTERAYGSDMEAAKGVLLATELKHSKEGPTIIIEDVYPDERPGGVDAISIDLNVIVPKLMAVDLETRNYRLDMKDVGGDVKLEARNGDASIEGVGGGAAIETRNGKVAARGVKGNAEVSMRNGSLEMEDIGGNLSIGFRNGSIIVNGVGKDLHVETRHGPVKIAGVKGDMDVKSRMGPVNIDFAPGYDFAMEVESKMGPVSCNFPTKKDDGRVKAKSGAGTHTVKIENSFGPVNISK